MRKTLLLTILFFCQMAVFAQAPTSIQCTMTIAEISESQPYHLDHPKQEETFEISQNLINELTAVYDLVNQGSTSGLTAHIDTIDLLVIQATQLGMNYSMFQVDLDYVATLN